MKKIFLIVLFIILACSVNVNAAPYLICDPYISGTMPEYFYVQTDGGTWVKSTPQSVTGGGLRLYFDLASYNMMTRHDFAVTACILNDYGTEACSAATNFTFIAESAPVTPSGVRVIP